MDTSVFLGGQPRPHPKVKCAIIPQIFGTYMRAHSMRNSNQILRGDQTRCEANFYSQSQMLTHDLFVVVTLLVKIPSPSPTISKEILFIYLPIKIQ